MARLLVLRATAAGLAAAAVLSFAACGDSSDLSSTRDETTTGSPSDHEGGEESVEGFGAEAEGSDRREILTAEQSYLDALAESDFEWACSFLSSQAQRSLGQLVQQSQAPCPRVMFELLSPAAPATAREQASGEISKVRIQGDRAFVLFRAPGAKHYVLPMVREKDAWRVATVAASVLVPSAATLGVR